MTNHVTWAQLIEAQLQRHNDILVEVYSQDPEQCIFHPRVDEDGEDEWEEYLPPTFTYSLSLTVPGLNDPFTNPSADLAPPFTAWGIKRVYFPAHYDGRQWVASVPRNPGEEVTNHVGGG